MNSDQGKLFVGGIAWDTTEQTLTEYFGKYGEVTETVILHDKVTQRPRGFGFVVFSNPSVLDTVLKERHSIGGHLVEAKRALSREQQHTFRPGDPNGGRSFGGAGNCKKIFVGGLPATLTEDEFRQYFETYGEIADVVIMFDQNTNQPRGFGFVTFDTEDAVEKVLHKTYHELSNKLCEVKRALPKNAQQDGGQGGGGGRGGGYQGCGGSSGGSTRGYGGRMDGNSFMQPQSTGGGYPPFSGYGPSSYVYGAANSMGYGVGGYGSANAGYGDPTGAYGNPGGPNTGYMAGPQGSQTHGYGSSGYGAMGQSPVGASGYGNYGGNGGGYGNFGGRSGSAPNKNSGSGEEQQGGGGGYMY